ncbi:MAG: hypothetical protein LIO94_03690 [Clostridiales bacterium]|nr:hypothetical protein [Clostridiales bacterium]
MKKLTKRMISLLLACIMLFGAVPVSADTTGIPSSQVVYQTSTSSSYQYGYISLNDLSAKVKSPKSSNTSVASVYSLSNGTYTSKNYEYDSSSSNRYATITLKLKKAGTTKVTYKVGSTSYTTKVTVKAYSNPVKKITLTNVNSSKNFASASKTSANVYDNDSLKLSKTTSNAKLNLTAASGWKISSIYVSDSKYADNVSTDNSFSRSYSSGKEVSSVKNLNIGKLTAGRNHYLYITFVNSKTNGTLEVSYSF